MPYFEIGIYHTKTAANIGTLWRTAHPRQAIYLLGAEDHGLPPDVLARCNSVVSLEAVCRPSYNVAVAGSIILYDRIFPR